MARTPNSADFRRRMTPPKSLAEGPATIWKQIVHSVTGDHFRECDHVLLAEFCRAADLANRAAAAIEAEGAIVAGKANPWVAVQEKCQKSLVALALRLRLAPQSRHDRLKAGTSTREQFPELLELDPDDPMSLLYGPFAKYVDPDHPSRRRGLAKFIKPAQPPRRRG